MGEPASSPALARASSQYVSIGRIAAGGMGYVELVLRVEGSFRRLHARKRLHAHYRDDPELRQMFVEEARLAGLLRHPNVIAVLDVGSDDEGPYLVMDFVDGVSVSALIADVRRRDDLLPVGVCVEIARQTALALAAAHDLRDVDGSRLQLVHRDVSPQNVLVDYDGVVRLGDFGVAKALGRAMASTTDALKGKVGYMSPEQLRFESLDHRSDLFALGVVLYELLAAERLYIGRDVPTVARAILDGPPPDVGERRPDVPPALEELLLDLLARSPGDRPGHAAEVAKRLAVIRRQLDEEGGAELSELMHERFGARREAQEAERAKAIEVAEAGTMPRVRAVERVSLPSSGATPISQPATRVQRLAPRARSRRVAAGLAAAGALLLLAALAGLAQRGLGGEAAPESARDGAAELRVRAGEADARALAGEVASSPLGAPPGEATVPVRSSDPSSAAPVADAAAVRAADEGSGAARSDVAPHDAEERRGGATAVEAAADRPGPRARGVSRREGSRRESERGGERDGARSGRDRRLWDWQ